MTETGRHTRWQVGASWYCRRAFAVATAGPLIRSMVGEFGERDMSGYTFADDRVPRTKKSSAIIWVYTYTCIED